MRILIPTYEPTIKLIKLIEEIQDLTQIPIIVVNDGSDKKYQEIFKTIQEKHIKILTHDNNKGKGEALKTGIQYLLQIGDTQGCVCADSDGQHRAKDIVKIAQELQASKKDMILGVRNFKGNEIPFRSKFGNTLSKILFHEMTGERIIDTQTGLRAYSAKIFTWLLQIEGNRYEYEFNMLLKLREDKIKYKTIEIQTIYEHKNKVSHFRPIQDSILIYKPVCKFLLFSIISASIDFGLLLIFEYTLKNLLIAVVLSRSISSLFNFVCNKNYVFKRKSKHQTIPMAIKYYVLVIIIMIGNYLILNGLYKIVKMKLIFAKIITEIILYFFSFIIQKRVVFTKM